MSDYLDTTRSDQPAERHIKIVFDVLGKALDWFDRKGALE